MNVSKSFEQRNIVKKIKTDQLSCLAHESSSHFPRCSRGKYAVFTGADVFGRRDYKKF